MAKLFGQALPAGEYTFVWRYGRLKSNTARFTVQAGDAEVEPAARDSSLAVWAILDDGPLEEVRLRRIDDDDPETIENTQLDPVDVDRLAMVLATGVEGKYYPDFHRIPSADNLLRVTARFKMAERPHQIEITFSTVMSGLEAAVKLPPQFFLVVESDGVAARERYDLLDRARVERQTRVVSEQPLKFVVHLPEDWAEGLEGTTPKVSVIVCSENLQDRLDWSMQRLKMLEEKEIPRADDPPLWRGVLRSVPLEVDLTGYKTPPKSRRK